MATNQRGGSGNFAMIRGRQPAKRAPNTQGGQQQQGSGSQGQQSGNPGNFANGREKASEAGRKGGQH
jgi:hypothetical protein